jgi:hypothetical protein
MKNTNNYNELTGSCFEVFGFFKELFIDRKYMGTVKCEYEAGRTLGYFGRKVETFNFDIITDNKKKIKAGVEVETILMPFCGKRIKQSV